MSDPASKADLDAKLEAAGRAVRRDDESRTSQADAMVGLVTAADVVLWHTPAGEPYATVHAGERIENLAIRSRRFQTWLRAAYFDAEERAPRREAIHDASGVLEGHALRGEEREVNVRLAPLGDDEIYLDLADDAGRAVKVTRDGWSVIEGSAVPVRFRRPDGMLALPVPERGGSVDDLRPLVNVPEGGWILYVGWLVGALHPRGPYPILAISGEQGSAKSTTARLSVLLLDPRDVPLRREPREERDLAIAARHSRILSFNNLSSIRPAISDAFASVATEGGFATRALHTDDDEMRFRDRRPIILNGIPDVVTRGDLGDRAIRLELPRIQGRRRTEKEIDREYYALRPRILGALLDAVAAALRGSGDAQDADLPRMADFAVWVAAAETALGWEAGTFMVTYRAAIDAASAATLDGDLVAEAVRRLTPGETWEGTTTALLDRLVREVPENRRKEKDGGWPRGATGLAATMRRLAPDLRRAGYVVDDSRRDPRSRARLWRIVAPVGRTTEGENPSHPSQASQPVAIRLEPGSGREGLNGATTHDPSHDPSQGDAGSWPRAARAKGAKGAKGCEPLLSAHDDGQPREPGEEG